MLAPVLRVTIHSYEVYKVQIVCYIQTYAVLLLESYLRHNACGLHARSRACNGAGPIYRSPSWFTISFPGIILRNWAHARVRLCVRGCIQNDSIIDIILLYRSKPNTCKFLLLGLDHKLLVIFNIPRFLPFLSLF